VITHKEFSLQGKQYQLGLLRS